ncbi:MAG: HEAT repeat domain-containing protein [Alphaproteobacteria bacterium]|nr:HEAT repeat domain-containing protein [Alphaproteobacteria bacterium]MCB9695778.1 HEAT repeat domain-containing protein [Alphaproteobacteria bacterium]
MITALGLAPHGFGDGALSYVGTHEGMRVRITVGVLLEGHPVEVEVDDPQAPADAWLALPAASVPVRPSVRTGDRMFDGLVALVLGGEVLLPWLDRRTRGRIALAAGLGAAVSNRRCSLLAAATRGMDAERAQSAVETLIMARQAVRESLQRPLVERWLVSDGAPAVEEAVAREVERNPGALSAADAERMVRRVLERGEDPDVRLAPLVRSRPVLRALTQLYPQSELLRQQLVLATEQMDANLAADLLCARLSLGLTDDLPWLPAFASRPDVVAAVLDAHEAEPGAAVDLVLLLDPSLPRLVERLAGALTALDHPRALRRLLGLLPRASEAVAAAVVERVRREIAAGRAAELDDLSPHLVNTWLFKGLMALPDEAAPWLATLRPRDEDRQLELVRRLARSPAPEVEERLVELLREGMLPVRREAARSLSKVGGRVALPVLTELVDGWLVDAELRGAARTAVEDIRRRHAQGGLSVATDGGALSEADEPGGGLSVTRR